jgi:vitamin K-dependent gamma-carboxylase
MFDGCHASHLMLTMLITHFADAPRPHATTTTSTSTPTTPRPTVGPWARARRAASDPVAASSLAVVRAVYGAVGLLSAARLLAYGWVDSLYAEPALHFTYPGFHWVRPLPGVGMHAVVVVMALAAGLVLVGCWYRTAMATFLVAFTWVELIDVTTYLNHYWFMTIVGVLMVVSPMAVTGSIDARRRPPRSATVPRGLVWLFRAQIAVVYLFAGVAKLDADWLLHALPLRLWLPARTDLALVGPWLGQPAVAFAFSWGGALFDCTIVGFLLWRRTRLLAWLVVIAFHVATGILFPIGVFPWLMIGMTTVFFDPDWPRVLRARLTGVPATGLPTSDRRRSGSRPTSTSPRRRTVLTTLALAWMAVQVALPLRHVLYPGAARWTGEGYRFSWNVLAAEKSGSVEFRVTDRATGRTRTTSAEERYTPLQWRTMASEPELIRQAAHALHDDAAAQGSDVEVRVDAFVSINGGVARRLIDPDVDLASEPGRLTPQPWILR